ncbi:hypothetical protein SEA_WOLLYPOG_71 [Arthrobacter phage Wollypog]|uniref:Uncharacterized protein n=1 Tax=Arthrobacter phage Wollypog TaxID=2790985 RepID=A0A7T3N1G5_9CAUD|nr:hypothetical protein PP291_gp71 [Arthrobacter phage Wollypog]QPX62642.1 hypothetical protein SEA_WOLLYPOG_71 [Arthrobacter phage Wollypog]
MAQCRAIAWTGNPQELVIRCQLEEGHKGSHASPLDKKVQGARNDNQD